MTPFGVRVHLRAGAERKRHTRGIVETNPRGR